MLQTNTRTLAAIQILPHINKIIIVCGKVEWCSRELEDALAKRRIEADREDLKRERANFRSLTKSSRKENKLLFRDRSKAALAK